MTAELAFIDALSKTSSKAGLAKELMKKVPGLLKKHKLPIGAAALGAALTSGGTYLATRPKKDTGLSSDQEQTRGVVNALEGKTGFLPERARAFARGSKELSDVAAKHPKKSALLAAPAGALGGLWLLKKLKG